MTGRAAALSSRRTLQNMISSTDNIELNRAVSRFLTVKDRSFSVSGSIPIPETDPIILFFRTSSGISHSLPFPLKTDIMHQLPALNVLLAACETSPDAAFDTAFDAATTLPAAEAPDHEPPLTWPAALPFATTFDLANHPILDTLRTVLFPHSHPGTFLLATRDTLDVFLAGARSDPRRPASSRGADGAQLVATLILTLPVRFRGGTLVVRHFDGTEERYPATQPQGPAGETLLHWTAFTAACQHAVEFVEQGSRMSISYGVYAKSFGPVGPRPNPLLAPNEQLLDALSPLLNLTRGRTLGVYLTGRYNCSPTDVLADSLVPSLKGSDAALYHALRLYKLTPELRWGAAGHVWPVDKTVQISTYVERETSRPRTNINYPYSTPSTPSQGGQGSQGSQGSSSSSRAAAHRRRRRRSVSRSAASYDAGSGVGAMGLMTGVGAYGHGSRVVMVDTDDDEGDEDGYEEVRDLVIEGGAVPLQECDILMLTPRDPTSSSREKVSFVCGGVMDRLYVNILLLVYVQ